LGAESTQLILTG